MHLHVRNCVQSCLAYKCNLKISVFGSVVLPGTCKRGFAASFLPLLILMLVLCLSWSSQKDDLS